MPSMIIVAGNNGAGKTTIAREHMGYASSSTKTWVNPDETTDALIPQFPEFAVNRQHPNIAAAGVSEARVDALIENRSDFVVETVLSSTKYIERVKKARANGMRVEMIYVTLELADLAVMRVKSRVMNGGHDVPEDKIRKRWATSQHNLIEFIPHLDKLDIFDNTQIKLGAKVPVFATYDGAANTLLCRQNSGLPYLRRVVRNAMMTGVAGFMAMGF